MKKDHTKKDNQDHSEKNAKKIKVALFCTAAILIFYLGSNFLKGIDVFGRKNYYYAVFDHAGGLQESNPVSINGYKVGKITHVKLTSSNPVRICAEILITEDIEIPIDSKFEVTSKDLLGGTVVNLIMGTSPKYATSGDTLACYVVPPVTSGLDDMKSKLNNILASVDTIGTSLKEVIKLDGAQNLQSILSNIEQSTAHLNIILAQNKFKVGEIVSNFEAFSQTLKKANPELKMLVDNFESISDTLAKANVGNILRNVDKAVSDIEAIVNKVNNGEGSMGQILNNDTLYRNLDATMGSLNALLVDLKENPKKYVNITVFGKKDKSEKTAEKTLREAQKAVKKKE